MLAYNLTKCVSKSRITYGIATHAVMFKKKN